MKLISLLVGLTMAGAASAQELVIDDFSTGDFQGGEFSYFYQTYLSSSTGSMVGGKRGVSSTNNDGFKVDDGIFSYDSRVQYGPIGDYNQYHYPVPGVRLAYGTTLGLFDQGPIKLNLTEYSRFRVSLPNATEAFRLGITASMYGSPGDPMQYGFASFSTLVNPSAGPVDLDLWFNNFTTENFDWTKVDAIQLTVLPVVAGEDVSVNIDQITAAVPEPETYALTALGLGGLIAQLRRRRG